jgi:hypothetical protein
VWTALGTVMNCRQFSDQLCDCLLLKEDSSSSSWSWNGFGCKVCRLIRQMFHDNLKLFLIFSMPLLPVLANCFFPQMCVRPTRHSLCSTRICSSLVGPDARLVMSSCRADLSESRDSRVTVLCCLAWGCDC